MKTALVLCIPLLLLVACSDAADEGDAPVKEGAALEALQASMDSEFPTVPKGAYAPWAKMQPEAYSVVHPEDAPLETDIEIPRFRDSYIINAGTTGEGSTALEFVTLICADAPEAVQDFYLRELVELKGWSYESQYYVFQPGQGNDFLVNSTPFVSVTELNPHSEEMRFVDRDFLGNFRTRIQICYR